MKTASQPVSQPANQSLHQGFLVEQIEKQTNSNK